MDFLLTTRTDGLSICQSYAPYRVLYLNVLFALLTVYKLFVLGKDGLSWLEMGYAERNLELAQQLHAYYQKTFPNEVYGIMMVDEPALTSPLAQIA